MGHHVRGCKIVKLILRGVICVENIFYDISIKKHCVEKIVADKNFVCVTVCYGHAAAGVNITCGKMPCMKNCQITYRRRLYR